ncbi:flagellar hook capping FlgD N-terminal domain-containing protein [Pseudaeromonas sp. ZJS20]|uniref:flagellar hook assembly protein FlgD n=1 Tax=Pseudaeromonas aegiceratis TaxID=3153928 RepID=UPI00390CD85E
MTISAITSSSSTSSTDSTSSESVSSNADALQIQFIDLLVAQIQNQDPTDPQDSSEYVSQLSQLSMVQSLEELNDLQSTSNDEVSSLAALQSTSLVGKQVLSETDSVTLSETGTISGQVSLTSAADSLTIYAYDSSGNLVASETSSSLSAGTYGFSFANLEAGTYTVEAQTSSDGSTSSLSPSLYSEVASVTLDDDGVQLTLSDGSSVSLDDVLSVSNG